MNTDNNITDKPTILAVDDNPSSFDQISNTFRDSASILSAVNYQNGMEIAENEQPDLILLNEKIKESDGLEVCLALQKRPETRDIPIIVMSNNSENSNEAGSINAGAVDFIFKPLDENILKARVENQLRQKNNLDFLKTLSSIDALTEIPNRRFFDERLDQEWKRATRERYSISLLMIDIDHFKSYNDSYGHLQGDECLKTVARNLSQNLWRSSDIITRYGGEEFAVILPGTPSYSALNVAKRLWESISALEIEHSSSLSVGYLTVSIGLATLSPNEKTKPHQLIELADKNLYKSKTDGRNRVTG